MKETPEEIHSCQMGTGREAGEIYGELPMVSR